MGELHLEIIVDRLGREFNVGINVGKPQASYRETILESATASYTFNKEIKGFKPYSHEALVSFLKEYKLISDEKANILDNYRILRNNSVYKAEKISPQKCIEALEFAKKILPEIKAKFDEIGNTKPDM